MNKGRSNVLELLVTKVLKMCKNSNSEDTHNGQDNRVLLLCFQTGPL